MPRTATPDWASSPQGCTRRRQARSSTLRLRKTSASTQDCLLNFPSSGLILKHPFRVPALAKGSTTSEVAFISYLHRHSWEAEACLAERFVSIVNAFFMIKSVCYDLCYDLDRWFLYKTRFVCKGPFSCHGQYFQK